MKALCQPDDWDICYQCLSPLPKQLRRTCSAYLKENPPRIGLGTRIANWLAKKGYKKRPGCGCVTRELKINRWEEKALLWWKKFWRKSAKSKARKQLATLPPLQEKDRQAMKEAYRAQLLAQQKS